MTLVDDRVKEINKALGFSLNQYQINYIFHDIDGFNGVRQLGRTTAHMIKQLLLLKRMNIHPNFIGQYTDRHSTGTIMSYERTYIEGLRRLHKRLSDAGIPVAILVDLDMYSYNKTYGHNLGETIENNYIDLKV